MLPESDDAIVARTRRCHRRTTAECGEKPIVPWGYRMEYDSGEKAREVRGPDAKPIVFEDLVRCDERSLCLILREVEALDLTKALKGAGPALQEKVLATMGNRGAWLIKEDMKFLGNLPRDEVEQAQNMIIAVAAKLEDAGEIVIPRKD